MMTYDKSKVNNKYCISCHKPIGNKEYEEVNIFARFGNMLFRHKDCIGIDRECEVTGTHHCLEVANAN
jgi:hypothetical protein